MGPPRAFGDQVDRSNQQTSSSGKVKRTGEHFSWYGSDNLRANIEQPSCRQYKPGDFLAIRPLNWNEIIDEDDDDENWADPGASSSGWSRPSHDTHNDDGEGEEDMQGGEKGTGKGKGTKNVKRKGNATEDQKGKGRGMGRETVKGKELLNTPQKKMISLVLLLCSCRRNCQRQTWTRRANESGYI